MPVPLLTSLKYTNIYCLFVSSASPSINIVKVYPTDTELLLVLKSNEIDTSIFDVQYQIKYWSKLKQITKASVLMSTNMVRINNLLPNNCYYFSLQYTMRLPNDISMTSNWTKEILFCTTARAMIATPKQFTCFKKNLTQGINDVPVIELTWRKPSINQITYGVIESYKLSIDFINFPYAKTVTYSIASTSNSVENFLTQLNGYREGGVIKYTLALCNNNGCSRNNVSCSVHLFIPGGELNGKPGQIPIILACVIPVISFLVLVVAGFVSYYRKKEIEKDLCVDDSTWINGTTNLGASVSSRGSSLQEHPDKTTTEKQRPTTINKKDSLSSIISKDEAILEKPTKNTKFAEENVLSVSRDNIARLFIQTFSPSRNNKAHAHKNNEPLLDNKNTEQVSPENIV